MTEQTNFIKIDPQQIQINYEENKRQDYGDFEELKENIKYNGVKVPVNVCINENNYYELTHGYRRLYCVLQLIEEDAIIIDEIPANVVENDHEEILLDHLTLNSGKPLSQYEQSDILIEFEKFGYKLQEIAQITGFDYQKVSYLIRFQKEAGNALKTAVQHEKMAIQTAIEILRETKGNEEKQNEILAVATKNSDLLEENRITAKTVQDTIKQLYGEDEEDNTETQNEDKDATDEETDNEESDNEEHIEPEGDNSKSDGEVSVETETDQDSEPKSSSDSEEKIDIEYHLWQFTLYLEKHKSDIDSSKKFFDFNRFIKTLKGIQMDIEDNSYEEIFNSYFKNQE